MPLWMEEESMRSHASLRSYWQLMGTRDKGNVLFSGEVMNVPVNHLPSMLIQTVLVKLTRTHTHTHTHMGGIHIERDTERFKFCSPAFEKTWDCHFRSNLYFNIMLSSSIYFSQNVMLPLFKSLNISVVRFSYILCAHLSWLIPVSGYCEWYRKKHRSVLVSPVCWLGVLRVHILWVDDSSTSRNLHTDFRHCLYSCQQWLRIPLFPHPH